MEPDVKPVAEETASRKKLVIPAIVKKFMIPGIAAIALLIAGGVAFGLLHGHAKPAPAQPKVASAASAASDACSGVVRDLYRQSVDDDPSVTLAEVRAEVAGSGVSCAPDAALADQLKDLSPACRDMVQYTFLSVTEGHSDITVLDVRPKVVEKSVACEHDRSSSVASAAGRPAKK